MWIFFNNSFLSIIKNRYNSGNLLVRSRIPGDIEIYFPEAQVTKGENSDYLYRAFVNRREVASKMSEVIMKIDYDNFKHSVLDGMRRKAYTSCWQIMREYQIKELERLTWLKSDNYLENH